MTWILDHKTAVASTGGLLLPVAVAALLIPFRTSFVDTAAALVLVAVIVAVGTFGRRTAGYLAAVSASLSFDFFLTRPYERFQMNQRSDIETAISLFVVGIVVTELAERSRRFQRRASTESDYVGLISRVSSMVAGEELDGDVAECISAELVDLLGLRSCHYEAGRPTRRRAVIGKDGQVIHGGVRWEVEDIGLPGPESELPVHCRGEVVGRFVLIPTPGEPVELRRRIVAVALADQFGSRSLWRVQSLR